MKIRALMSLILVPFLASCGEEVDLYERGSAIAYALSDFSKYSPESGNVIFKVEHYHLALEVTNLDYSRSETVDFSSSGYYHGHSLTKETHNGGSVKSYEEDKYFVILEEKCYLLQSGTSGSSSAQINANESSFFSDLNMSAITQLMGLGYFRSILFSYLSSLRPGKEVSLMSSYDLLIKGESTYRDVVSKAKGNLSFRQESKYTGTNYLSEGTTEVSYDNYLPISYRSNTTSGTGDNSSGNTHTSTKMITFDWSRYEEVIPSLSDYPTPITVNA